MLQPRRDNPPADAPYRAFTGETYFKQINSVESSRRARARFQQLVLKTAPAGAVLFDFGAGPGIDARYFAERGFRVGAYDIDPKMCDFFALHCRDLIDSGRVWLERGDYREFLAREAPDAERRAALVVSNLAPLNQVDDLQELFAKFHALTLPEGKVLASVLSPYYLRDMRNPWWWRIAPRLWRDRRVFMPGGPWPPHNRRRLADYAALSLPHFELARVFRGLAPLRAGPRDGVDVRRDGHYAWLHATLSEFMLLLFEKRAR